MMGPTHRLLGFAAGAGCAAATGYNLPEVILSGAFASASSHGGLSPDIDQTKIWVAIRKALPDKMARLFNHRNLSHWWGLPILGYMYVETLPMEFAWPVLMLLSGWVSHLVGDLIFGFLPVDPWGYHTFGIGLDTGGFLETGTLKIRGKTHKILPFGPARALLGVGIAALLVFSVYN